MRLPLTYALAPHVGWGRVSKHYLGLAKAWGQTQAGAVARDNDIGASRRKIPPVARSTCGSKRGAASRCSQTMRISCSPEPTRRTTK